MKTLILNGSPRKNGDTVSLIRKLTENLKGEFKIIDAYRSPISPCVDCRYCREHHGCKINDAMQEIYPYIQECDNIVIASPIYFSELTGKLLDLGSRLQTYYCADVFRKEMPILKSKKGAVILVGGGHGSAEKAYNTACILLHHMNCYQIHEMLYSHDTDRHPAICDEKTLSGLHSILDFLNHCEK